MQPQSVQPAIAYTRKDIEYQNRAPLRKLAVGIQQRDYQDVGIDALWERKRFMLRDAPGLGKTPMAALAAEIPCLVVAPNYLVGQWGDFLTRVFPMLRTVVVKGDHWAKRSLLDDAYGLLEDKRQAAFTVINTEMLRTHEEILMQYHDLSAWTTIIFDESHHLKNRNAGRSKVAVALARNVKRVYLLTATPIWKEVDDLYNQFRIIHPTVFTSYNDFVNLFCIAEDSRYGTKVIGVKKSMIPELDAMMGQMSLGRTYKEAGRELPEVIASEVRIDFDERTSKMYQDVLNNFRLQLELADAGMTVDDLVEWNKANATRTTTLYGLHSEAEDEPSFDEVIEKGYNPDYSPSPEDSKAMLMFESYSAMAHTLRQISGWHGKVNAVVEAIMDTYLYHEGRVVVFTWYRDLAQKITKAINEQADKEGTKRAVCITGNITDANQRRFLATGNNIVVATISSLSEGVDLSWGRMVVFAEEHYSPGSHIQAMARVVRDRAALGNAAPQEPVLVNYIMTRNTIDEVVHQRSQQRGATIKEIIREAVGLI